VTDRVTITDLDQLGRGLGFLGGEMVMVPGGLPGETVQVARVLKLGRPRATVLSIEHPSANRVSADCDFASDCPGCTLRHVNFSLSRERKLDRLRRALKSNSRKTPEINWLGTASRNHYRTRAIARALVTSEGRLTLGMVGYHQTIPLGACPIQTSRCQTLINDLEADLQRLGLTYYDPLSRTGEVRHVIVDAYDSIADSSGPTERVVICLGRPLDVKWHRNTFLAAHQKTAVLFDTLAYRSPGLLRKPVALRHGESVYFRIDDDVIRSTLPAWCPQSPKTIALLRNTVLQWLAPESKDIVLEVGCGSGSNTIALARRCKAVIALDHCRAAIDDTRANAKTAKLQNIEARIGSAAKAIGRILVKTGGVDLAVCHGMRLPFGARAMASLSAVKPRRIVMVGPSANSLAADASRLVNYEVSRCGVLDQTPGTHLALCLLLMERK
jgi:23S rRNA (uracil1939-C5)-methyltransferase